MRHRAGVISADFSADGTRLVTASEDRTAQRWDVGTGEPIGPAMTHDGAIGFAVFAPDGLGIATVSNEDELERWDRPDEPASARRKLRGPVMAMRFVGTALRVVIAVEHANVEVVDGGTGEPLGPAIRLDGDVKSADIAPDGETIVTGSASGVAEVWNVRSGLRVGEPMAHDDWVQDVSFSADGRRVLTVSRTTTRVWDSGNGSPAGATTTHPDRIRWARFSPDGHRLVTTSMPGIVRIRDVGTGEVLDELRTAGDGFAFAAFDPGGTRLATGAADGTARVWSVAWSSYQDPQKLRQAVCARMNGDTRRITEADRQLASGIERADVGRDACVRVARPPPP